MVTEVLHHVKGWGQTQGTAQSTPSFTAWSEEHSPPTKKQVQISRWAEMLEVDGGESTFQIKSHTTTSPATP
jgi:hypothetical protein